MLARRRLRMYPEKLGNSTLTASVPLEEAESAVVWLQYLLGQINYRGIFSAEFKYDRRDGSFKLIEINARRWWYVEFAYRCGVDVCAMAYQDALGGLVLPVLDYAIGRRCFFQANDLRAWETSSGEGTPVWDRCLKPGSLPTELHSTGTILLLLLAMCSATSRALWPTALGACRFGGAPAGVPCPRPARSASLQNFTPKQPPTASTRPWFPPKNARCHREPMIQSAKINPGRR